MYALTDGQVKCLLPPTPWGALTMIMDKKDCNLELKNVHNKQTLKKSKF